MSPKSARKAEELGYRNVKVYHDGLPAWKKRKNPVYSTVESLESRNQKEIPYILVDVISAGETSGGVIPGAVAIPAVDLEEMEDDFPPHKKAPIILYAASDTVAEKAFAVVRGWGYKGVSVLEGGVSAWTAAGRSLDDKAKKAIDYVSKPRPGEIAPAEFERVAAGDSPGKVLLDVRGRGETSNGMIEGALNIPLSELSARLDELPKGREIVAQCNTGTQAEMAWNLLSEKGFKSRWLNAKILIDEDGSWEVEED